MTSGAWNQLLFSSWKSVNSGTESLHRIDLVVVSKHRKHSLSKKCCGNDRHEAFETTLTWMMSIELYLKNVVPILLRMGDITVLHWPRICPLRTRTPSAYVHELLYFICHPLPVPTADSLSRNWCNGCVTTTLYSPLTRCPSAHIMHVATTLYITLIQCSSTPIISVVITFYSSLTQCLCTLVSNVLPQHFPSSDSRYKYSCNCCVATTSSLVTQFLCTVAHYTYLRLKCPRTPVLRFYVLLHIILTSDSNVHAPQYFMCHQHVVLTPDSIFTHSITSYVATTSYSPLTQCPYTPVLPVSSLPCTHPWLNIHTLQYFMYRNHLVLTSDSMSLHSSASCIATTSYSPLTQCPNTPVVPVSPLSRTHLWIHAHIPLLLLCVHHILVMSDSMFTYSFTHSTIISYTPSTDAHVRTVIVPLPSNQTYLWLDGHIPLLSLSNNHAAFTSESMYTFIIYLLTASHSPLTECPHTPVPALLPPHCFPS